MTDAEVAKYLGLPEAAVTQIRQRKYGAVVRRFKMLWNKDGYGALMRYGHAVDRLLEAFEQTFNRSPFYPTISENTLFTWKKQIALIVERFGNIAPLIDDMKQVKASGGVDPRSITWFVSAPEGQEVRWVELYIRMMERQDEEMKRRELSWRPSGGMEKILDEAAHPVTPTWVANARKRLSLIQPYITGGTATEDMKKDYRELTHNLTRFGYISLEEQAL